MAVVLDIHVSSTACAAQPVSKWLTPGNGIEFKSTADAARLSKGIDRKIEESILL